MKKPIAVITIAFFLIVALSIVRVVVASGMSTSGIDLDKLQEEISYYKTQNIVLKEKLLTITSFDYVASKASSMGFVESKTSISLNKPIPLARKQ